MALRVQESKFPDYFSIQTSPQNPQKATSRTKIGPCMEVLLLSYCFCALWIVNIVQCAMCTVQCAMFTLGEASIQIFCLAAMEKPVTTSPDDIRSVTHWPIPSISPISFNFLPFMQYPSLHPSYSWFCSSWPPRPPSTPFLPNLCLISSRNMFKVLKWSFYFHPFHSETRRWRSWKLCQNSPWPMLSLAR